MCQGNVFRFLENNLSILKVLHSIKEMVVRVHK